MAEFYLIRGARQLVTLRGSQGARRGPGLSDLAVINDGALLIRDGIIQEVGPTKRVENLAAARHAEAIEASGSVVMPAFVDSAVSLIYAHSAVDRNDARLSSKSAQTPESQRADILDGVRALKLVSKRRLILRGAEVSVSIARHGTGTAGVVSGYGMDDTGELKSLRSAEALDGRPLDLIRTHLGANAAPDEHRANAGAFARAELLPMLPVVAKRKLASFAGVRCGEGAFDFETAREYLSAARQAGLEGMIFAQQFGQDESVRLALETHAAAMVHLEHLRGWHLDLLASSNTTAILTPAATMHMGLSCFAPARQLVERGAAIALATAFNADTCPTFSMPYTISLACRHLGLTAAEAIAAATINAAHAQRCEHLTGSLEAGKQADLLLMDLRDYRELPLQPGVNAVRMMMKKGRILYRHGAVKPPLEDYDD